MKFYITGGAGWLGTNLLIDLMSASIPQMSQESHTIQGITTLTLDSENLKLAPSYLNGVKDIKGDIRNIDDCDKFLSGGDDGVLIHCAGIIHPSKVSDFYDINLHGTANLVRSAIKNNLSRVVVVSSNSPIGISRSNQVIFDEKTDYNPYMNYGRSKMLMEKMVIEECEGRIEFCILRVPWFYGPYQPARQTQFFTMIKEGKFPIFGGGTNLRSMSYTGNTNQGIYLASTRQLLSNVYWLADEKPYRMIDVITTVARVLKRDFGFGVKDTKVFLPSFICDLAEVADYSLQKIGAYHQKIHVLSEMNKTIACDIGLAKKELGYSPQVDLEQGMRSSIKWLLDNNVGI